jgi:hypothetical protein
MTRVLPTVVGAPGSSSTRAKVYAPGASRFTGTIEWVHLAIDEAAEDLDHLIFTRRAPEDRHGEAVSAAGDGDPAS